MWDGLCVGGSRALESCKFHTRENLVRSTSDIMRERKSEYQTVGRDYKREREGGSERRGERPDRTRTTKKNVMMKRTDLFRFRLLLIGILSYISRVNFFLGHFSFWCTRYVKRTHAALFLVVGTNTGLRATNLLRPPRQETTVSLRA